MRPNRLSLALAFFGASALAATALAATGHPAEQPGRVEAPIATGKNYEIAADLDGACKAGSACTVKVVLTAQNGYHINKDYPYKLKLQDAPGVDLDGKDAGGKNVFSKAAGDFTIDSETQATLRVRFKAAKAGALTLAGTFKMSVCSAANCQLETAEVSIPVTVK